MERLILLQGKTGPGSFVKSNIAALLHAGIRLRQWMPENREEYAGRRCASTPLMDSQRRFRAGLTYYPSMQITRSFIWKMRLSFMFKDTDTDQKNGVNMAAERLKRQDRRLSGIKCWDCNLPAIYGTIICKL